MKSPGAVNLMNRVARGLRRRVRDGFRVAIAAGWRGIPPSVRVAAMTRVPTVARLDYDRAEILMSVETEVEFDTRLHSCAKEPELMRWLTDTFRPGDVLYDCGANVGAYSLVAALCGGAECRVYAFEPGATTFAQLCRNVALNGLDDVITPLPVALTDTQGLVQFNYSRLAAGAALHSVGAPVDWKGDAFTPAYRQPVLGYAMDAFRLDFGLPVPTHLKIDVDGGERALVAGAEATLSERALRWVFLELDEAAPEADWILNSVRRAGFTVDSTHPCVTGPGAGRAASLKNFIFGRH